MAKSNVSISEEIWNEEISTKRNERKEMSAIEKMKYVKKMKWNVNEMANLKWKRVAAAECENG